MGGRGARSMIGKSRAFFSEDEADAVEYYVSGDGMYINDMLRNGDAKYGGKTQEDIDYIKSLDDATSKTIHDTTLYRSVDAESLFGKMSDTEYEILERVLSGDKSFEPGGVNYNYYNKVGVIPKIKELRDKSIGKVINDKGFMSTTKDYSIAKDWGGFSGSNKPVILEIKTNRNTKGADVSKIRGGKLENMMNQREVLLARNQKYKINRIGKRDGNIYVNIEIV